MINLLPEIEKKKLKKIYYFRIGVVVSGLLAIIALVSVTFILPSYFLVKAKEVVFQEQLATLKKNTTNSVDESLNTIIKDINAKLKTFPDSNKDFIFTRDVYERIYAHKTTAITLTYVNYTQLQDGGLTVSVSGSALNRDALLAFEQALKDEPTFKGVALPISNFIKGSNIEFTISFTLTL